MRSKEQNATEVLTDCVPIVNGQPVRPGARIGHFDIVKKLGNGAMASVYLGIDVDLQREVALKFLDRNALTTGNRNAHDLTEKRFIREAQSAAMINHPNVAKIFEADFNHECWYIVMEFINGACLQDLIDDGHKYEADELLDFISQTTAGLHHAWDNHRIIHRDVKPQNLMVNTRNVYKLVDLGLAKPIFNGEKGALQLTTTGIPVGTPYYMAPEQAEGRADIDNRADVFALGATIHEMCTGKKTFEARSAPMVYMAQMGKKYDRLYTVRDDLPMALSELVDRMLEPKLEERIADYSEIANIVNKCRKEMETKKKNAATKKGKTKRTQKKNTKNENVKNDGNLKVHTVELSSNEVEELKNKGRETKKRLNESTTPKRKKSTSKTKQKTKKENDADKAKPVAKAKPVEKTKNVQKSIYDLDDAEHEKNKLEGDNEYDKDVAQIILEIKKKKNLPALDKNVMELTNMARKRNSCVSDLTKVIQRDSSLTSNLLSTMNSSLYSPRFPIENVSNAVVLLGFDKVKSLAARLSIFSQAHKSVRENELYVLLTSSYFAGTFTQGMMNEMGMKNGEEAFVAGLLHQMPKLILANTFPKRYTKLQKLVIGGTTFNKACENVFKVPYPEICQAIHDAWQLPKGVACSFVDANGPNSFMKPFIKEACHVADMMFGQVLGGKREMAAAQERIRKILRKPNFELHEFMFDKSVEDESIRRFFHLAPAEIQTMVKKTVAGTAHLQKKEALVDMEQPMRIVTSKQRRKIDSFSKQILRAAKVDHDVNKAIEMAQRAIRDCIGVDCVFTILLTTKRDKLQDRFFMGRIKNFDTGQISVPMSCKESKLVRTIEQKRTIRCTASKRNLQIPTEITKRIGMRQVMLSPIIVDGLPIGLFMLGRNLVTARYDDCELAQVELLAEALASIFEKFSSKKKKNSTAKKK